MDTFILSFRQGGIEGIARATTASVSRGWLEQSNVADCWEHHARVNRTDFRFSVQCCSAIATVRVGKYLITLGPEKIQRPGMMRGFLFFYFILYLTQTVQY